MCGRALVGERLVVSEDDESVTVVYALECPNRDFYAAVTEPDLRRFASELVFERLR